MGTEIITVVVGGERFTAWKRVQIAASMKEAARSFRLEVAAEAGALATAWKFRAGTELEIYANDDLLLRGFVDRYQPSISATSAGVTISGRSMSGDIVDSSAEHETGHFADKSPDEIGAELAKNLGIKIRTDQTLEKISYQLVPGQTIFRAIEHMSRQQGMTMMGEADGSILITKASSKRHAGGIIEGVNMLSGSADHNWSNRHSKYVVKGQPGLGTGADKLDIEAIARDKGVSRARAVVVVEVRNTTPELAKKRAQNRRDRAAGYALSASLTVQGFRDETGKIWTPNKLVWVESEFLNIVQDMLIESVSFAQDSGGSITTIEVVDPRAYGGKTPKVNKSGKAYGHDDSKAIDTSKLPVPPSWNTKERVWK